MKRRTVVLWCAWIMWSKWVIGGEPEIMGAYPVGRTGPAQVKQACEADAALLMSQARKDGLAGGVQYVCLPDSVDPRGPVVRPRPRS
jgi:hypothetical protein